MVAFLAKWLGESALMQSPLGGLLKAVPGWAWVALAAVAAFLLHQHVAHKAVADAYASGKADEAAHVQQRALEIKAKVDALTTSIAATIRSDTDAENRRISDAADALRLRAPGRAECTRVASVPAAPGGPQPSDGAGGAAVDRVPYPQWEPLLAMPSAPTVTFAEQHDLNRAEVIAWREWYRKEADAFPPPPVAPVKPHRSLLQRLNPF